MPTWVYLRRLVWLVLAGVLVGACNGGTPTQTPGSPPQAAPAVISPSPQALPAVDEPLPPTANPPADAPDPPVRVIETEREPRPTYFLDISDPDERAAWIRNLTTAGLIAGESSGSAVIVISERELPDAESVSIAAWAVITHQRSDVFALTGDQVRAAASGVISDWRSLGGTARPVTVYVPDDRPGLFADALGAAPAISAIRLPLDEIVAAVAQDPGGLALVPASILAPGVLGIVVDGYDPYRDPATTSSLQTTRWLRIGPESPLDSEAIGAFWENGASFDPVGVLATGDVVPTRCTGARLSALGGFDRMFDGTRDLIAAADIAVLALETSLTAIGGPTPCERTFILQSSPEAAPAIAAAGFDVVTTAANHAGDCWGNCPRFLAFRDTIAHLEAAELLHTGTGEDRVEATTPALVERDGISFAFLSFDDIAHYFEAKDGLVGSATYDPETLGDDVRRAALLADHVIVSFSWGVEYTADPSNRQRQAARIAAQAGASLVIGNHPHWVQAVETIGETVVFYALGNFVFDQSWSTETTQGLLAEVGFGPDRVLGFRLRPIVIRDLHRPELVDPAGEGAAILRRTWEATDRLSPLAGS